jgi:hypothetical protein
MSHKTLTRHSLNDELLEITAKLLALQTKDGKTLTRHSLDEKLLDITARFLALQVEDFAQPSLQQRIRELKARVGAYRSQISDKDQQICALQSELQELKLQIPSRQKPPEHIRVRLPPTTTPQYCHDDLKISSQGERALPPFDHGSSGSSFCSSSSSIFSRENMLEIDSIHDDDAETQDNRVTLDSVKKERVLKDGRWLLQPHSQLKRHQRMLQKHEISLTNLRRSFTLFSALPLDIQKKIWRHTLPSTRVVEIYWCQKSETYRSCCPLPVTLHVCRVSRGEALMVYQKLGLDDLQSVYFNFHSDTILLGSSSLQTGDDYFMAFIELRIRDQLSEIRRLALELPVWKKIVKKSWFVEFLVEMDSLEEVAIIWSSFKKSRESYFGEFPPLPPSFSSVFEELEKERKLNPTWNTVIPKLKLVSAKRVLSTGNPQGRVERLRVFKYDEAIGNHGFWSIEEHPLVRLEKCTAIIRGFLKPD